MRPAKQRDPWGASLGRLGGGTPSRECSRVSGSAREGARWDSPAPETDPASEMGEVGRGVLRRRGAGRESENRKKRLLCNLSLIEGD